MELTYEHWSQVPRTGAAWPWKYFVPEEVACQGTGKLLVNRELLNNLKADAADISIVGQDKIKIRDTAREAGFTGFGYYQTFLHVDLGRPRDWGKEKWND